MSNVTIYSDSNYGGKSQQLSIGKYDVGDLTIGNDALSSLKVTSGLKVTLYQNEAEGGNAMICVQDTPNVGKSVNDETSSIVVESDPSPKVIVYADADYQGWSQELAVGNYDSLKIGNDALSSLIVPTGYRVTLYQNSGFNGSSMILTSSANYVGDSANDSVSSVVVGLASSTSTGVFIHADEDYEGWNQELGVGKFDVSDLAIGNDAISSVTVPDGYKVTLYQDSGFSGNYVVLIADTASLGDFNDRTSSIVVEKMTAVPTLTLADLQALIEATAPKRYYESSDSDGPSSVDWFLQRATLVSSNGTSQPASNGLPTTGTDDGSSWLTIPTDDRGGDATTAIAYVNAKKSSNYWIDLQYWYFYPYNGAGVGKVEVIDVPGDINLSPMGEHGGDWEHVTFRVEIATKDLIAIYMAQHDTGYWYTPSDLEYENGVPLVYSSKHGHATYRDEGEHLTNSTSLKALDVTWFEFGLRNDTNKGSVTLDCRSKYQIVGADFLAASEVNAPQWLDYPHRWGPHIVYDLSALKDVINGVLEAFDFFPYSESDAANAVWNALPDEMKEEDGPTGPKFKSSWSGTE